MTTSQINAVLNIDQPPPLRRLDEVMRNRGLGGCRKAINKNKPPIAENDDVSFFFN